MPSAPRKITPTFEIKVPTVTVIFQRIFIDDAKAISYITITSHLTAKPLPTAFMWLKTVIVGLATVLSYNI
jgi:hypothetical protein